MVMTLAALPMVSPGSAEAYDSENTHRWIARAAVELLVETYPGEYDEVLEYAEEIVSGAYHEDDEFLDGDTDPLTFRVMRHFYHAPTKEGLTYNNQTFPNSYQWHGIQSEENQWDYHDGMQAYQRGDLKEAYFIAGHTVHLISDLTVPAHAHLDDHPPPFGDDYENHCSSRTPSQYQSTLKTPAKGTIIPEFLDLEDIFQKTANASYYRNFYPGELGEEPSGVLFDMFPEMSQNIFNGKWRIHDVGDEGEGFYEVQPGYFYFSKNDAFARVDMVDYDPGQPDLVNFGPVVSNVNMVERMADELVPIAILHSAATIKHFVDNARRLPRTDEGPDILAAESEGGCNTSSTSSTTLFSIFALMGLLFLGLRTRKQTDAKAPTKA
jgi:hypothetical protein